MEIAFSRTLPRPSTKAQGGKRLPVVLDKWLVSGRGMEVPSFPVVALFQTDGEQDESFPNFVHRFDHQSWRNTMASGPQTPSLHLRGSQRPLLHASAKPLSLNTPMEGLEVYLPLRTVPSCALT